MEHKRSTRAFVAAAIAALLLSCAAAAGGGGGAHRKYDSLCDSMIQHAKAAAMAFNTGKAQEAEAHVASVQRAFDAAVALDPQGAQAYLNMAVFRSNTHGYDEAVQMYETAATLTGPKAPAVVKSTIERGIRTAKFKQASMRRDQAYAGGTGDLPLAHQHTLAQLAYTFEPHRVNHDLGTLEVMLCETNTSMCASSKQRFLASAYATQGHYFHSRVPETKARMDCMHSRLRVGNWTDGTVEVEAVLPGVFRNTVHEPARVRGRDGVVTLDHEGHCSLYSPSNDFYANLADNVLRPDAPAGAGGGSKVTGPVLSLVQFSGAAFYHWMCEALPRLAVAERSLGASQLAGMTLLLPALQRTPPSFVTNSLDFLFPHLPKANRAIHRTDTAVAGPLTVVTFAAQPCPPPTDPQLHCAALADPGALALARGLIQRRCAALRAQDGSSSRPARPPYVVLAGRGGDVTMRMFDEPLLLATLRPAMAALGLDVVHFDASTFTFAEAMELFAQAAMVVGAHGGAMGNLVACRQGTPVVEIGFATVGAQQYSHVALALGLPFRRVPVQADALGRALGAPTIAFDIAAVVQAAEEAVQASGGRRSGGGGGAPASDEL